MFESESKASEELKDLCKDTGILMETAQQAF